MRGITSTMDHCCLSITRVYPFQYRNREYLKNIENCLSSDCSFTVTVGLPHVIKTRGLAFPNCRYTSVCLELFFIQDVLLTFSIFDFLGRTKVVLGPNFATRPVGRTIGPQSAPCIHFQIIVAL